MSSEKDVIVLDGHLPGATDQHAVTEKKKSHDSSVSFEE
jgi:hypothetical protein